MGPKLSSPEESYSALMEMKCHQRRDVLLCIDELLTSLDSASHAADQREAARRLVQLIGGSGQAPNQQVF
jgi:hypothetical protein